MLSFCRKTRLHAKATTSFSSQVIFIVRVVAVPETPVPSISIHDILSIKNLDDCIVLIVPELLKEPLEPVGHKVISENWLEHAHVHKCLLCTVSLKMGPTNADTQGPRGTLKKL